VRLLLGIGAALLLAAPAQAATRDCGDVLRDTRPVYSITTTGPNCQHAREVASRFVKGEDRGRAREVRHGGRTHTCSWKLRSCRFYSGKTPRRVRWQLSVPYNTALASWYDAVGLGGRMGCAPFTYQGGYVVAHKTMPCGTRLEVCLNGCVAVYVGDRGPYVGGREFDLDAPVKDAIGFSGVQAIRWRYLR